MDTALCQTFRGVVIGEIPASTTTIRRLWVIQKPPIVASRTAQGKNYPLLRHFFRRHGQSIGGCNPSLVAD